MNPSAKLARVIQYTEARCVRAYFHSAPKIWNWCPRQGWWLSSACRNQGTYKNQETKQNIQRPRIIYSHPYPIVQKWPACYLFLKLFYAQELLVYLLTCYREKSYALLCVSWRSLLHSDFFKLCSSTKAECKLTLKSIEIFLLGFNCHCTLAQAISWCKLILN